MEMQKHNPLLETIEPHVCLLLKKLSVTMKYREKVH